MENGIDIEKIKAEVLAECQRLCPNRGDRYELNGPLLVIENFGSGWLFNMSLPEGTEIDLVSVARYTQDWSFVWAYRLLGLESRAKDAEIEWLRAALDSMTDSGFLLGRCDLFLEDESANNALKGGTNES